MLLATCSALSLAQAPAAALTPAEKAQRDAERVFDVIRFHTVRSKPARPTPAASTANAPAAARPATTAKAATPPAATASAPDPAARRALADGALSPAPAATVATAAAADRPQAGGTTPITTAEPPPASAPAAPTAMTEATADEPDNTDADGADEVPLRLQNFVAPLLSPELQATLGAGNRHVKVRVTVEMDGRVSRAEAAPGVPRRLARPATEAVMQWQFAPLPEARTADVDLLFRRD
ncbi:hypothetical protein [Roseateles sp. BYS87W]|uniref:TonB C-terminal domain-containing protein n=1 Tax=Pelomonas baiyunensis TaxID=3299026 RepID=A0ABW7H310_9BURK